MSETVLLTRVECICGSCAAIPEGGTWPLCGYCGRRMVAPNEGRVNYVSEPLPVGEAVQRHVAAGHSASGPIPGSASCYDTETLRGVLSARGYPVEAQDWPHVPSADGLSYPRPPWEQTA